MTGALCFKLASIYIYQYLIDHNLLFKVKLCIPAHDEWNVETPTEICDEISQVVQDSMKKAGAWFCKQVELPAEAEIGDCWIH